MKATLVTSCLALAALLTTSAWAQRGGSRLDFTKRNLTTTTRSDITGYRQSTEVRFNGTPTVKAGSMLSVKVPTGESYPHNVSSLGPNHRGMGDVGLILHSQRTNKAGTATTFRYRVTGKNLANQPMKGVHLEIGRYNNFGQAVGPTYSAGIKVDFPAAKH